MKHQHRISNTQTKTETNYREEEKLNRRKTKRGRNDWPRFFVIAFITTTILLSPLGTMITMAVDVPVLIAPNNGVITAASTDVPGSEYHPPLGIPELSWQPVEGATSYRVQVSSDIAFTTTVVNVVTTNTAYTPTDARNFADGTWYWRVRVERPLPSGQYSEVRSFTKQWRADENKPILLSPADETEIDFINEPFSFSWKPVMGAARYKLQIYTSPGGWATPAYSTTTLATTHQPKDKLANGTYYWRVLPVDPGNRDGMPSEERAFTANYNPPLTLLEPADNAQPTFTPTFRWTAVEGAQFYRLQYSTDFTFSQGVTQIDTRNTTYTPTSTLPNDVNYYWRVRVHSGSSISDWTESRTFVKNWYIKPVLLTPTNNYLHQRFPLFSWTPVPGASYYQVEVSFDDPNFSPIKIIDSGETANTFYSLNEFRVTAGKHYWRVTPYDGNGNQGLRSDTASFTMDPTSLAPHQVYPPYYYSPHEKHDRYEDRTAALPIFIWHRLFSPEDGQIAADSYRLQVSRDPLFLSVDWQIDTQNTVATPNADNPFTPLKNTDYFWRVRPMIDGSLTGQWSQRWETRIDTDNGLDRRPGDAPELIRPTAGYEFAEMTPLLEWFPLTGASAYDVQISKDENFGSVVDEATVPYPAYAPTHSLAQRSLGAVDFGVYYWRVRQSGGGAWSETRRFQIAAQSQWKATRTLGSLENRLQIGSNTSGNTDAVYELTSLQAVQSRNYWYFGFDIPEYAGVDVTYALYLDFDHQEGSGATSDARGYNVATIPAYQPEYAIYIFQEGGVFSSDKVAVYRWNGVGWDTPVLLADIGGDLSHESDYLEIQVPNTAIGASGSYAISLLSLPKTSPGLPKDAVPSVSNISTTGVINRFANVTERLNLILPPTNAGVDPTTFPSVQPFFWDWPVQAPWAGAIIEIYLDQAFTTLVDRFEFPRLTSRATRYYGRPFHAFNSDLQGDNTYFWRVRPVYLADGLINGSWSQGWRFERQGFVPQNLTESVEFATPTFSWDRVEGAEYYDLQIVGPGTTINVNTRQNTYTGLSTLANGTYNWQVRVRRYRRGGVINDWSAPQSFTLNLPTPELLSPAPEALVNRAPTLCWAPIIEFSGTPEVPVLTAWKYRVQVSQEHSFSKIFDNIDTEQTCWTPTKGYADGAYYWRVAMIDGNGKLGAYSEAKTFTKQYPMANKISPLDGEAVTSSPTFVWTPVDGAASYRLEISKFPSFAPTIDAITTNNTRFTSTKAYEMDQIYYWRVAIIDADRNQGPFTGSIELSEKFYLPLILK